MPIVVAVALLVGVVGPASAQFFNFGGPPRPQPRSGGWFGGDLFAPFQQQAPKRVVREDFSKAPPPEKRESVPERNVLVPKGLATVWTGSARGAGWSCHEDRLRGSQLTDMGA